jgi:hypothetical protein
MSLDVDYVKERRPNRNVRKRVELRRHSKLVDKDLDALFIIVPGLNTIILAYLLIRSQTTTHRSSSKRACSWKRVWSPIYDIRGSVRKPMLENQTEPP